MKKNNVIIRNSRSVLKFSKEVRSTAVDSVLPLNWMTERLQALVVFFLTLTMIIDASAAANNAGNSLIKHHGKHKHLAIAPGGDLNARHRLIKLLKSITGKTDFTLKDDVNSIVIHVGHTPYEKSLKLDYSRMHPYGYYMVCPDGKNLVLSGKNNSFYAIFDFLKRYCGYRKYGLSKLEEIIPRQQTIVLPDNINFKEEPDYKSYLACAPPNPFISRADRLTCRSTHAMWRVIPPAKYGKSNPEYYPLVDGKRRVPNPKFHAGWQPCLANPELINLVMEYADDYFKRYPNHLSLPLGVNDSAGDCLCRYCDDQYKNHGNQYATFYNNVARALKKRYPDKLVAFIAYGKRSHKAPRGIAMEPNILVEVIGLDENALNNWQKAGIKNFNAYDYLYTIGNGFVVPRYFPHAQAAQWLKFRNKYNVTGLFMEYSPITTFFAGPRQYVLDELAWNSSVEVDELLDDYFQHMYQEAAQPVMRFFNRLEAIAERDKTLFWTFRYWRQPDQMKHYTLDDLSYLDKQLVLAIKQATDPLVKKRLQMLSQLYKLVNLYVTTYQHGKVLGAVKNVKSRKDAEHLIAVAKQGYQAISELENFKLTPEEEKAIFASKERPYNLHKFRTQFRLHPLPLLERGIDSTFSKITDYLLSQNDWPVVRQFWIDSANSSTNNSFRKTALTQVYQRENPLVELMKNPGFEWDNKKPPLKSPETWLGKLYGWSFWRSSAQEVKTYLDSETKKSGMYSMSIGLNCGDCLLYPWPIKAEPNCRYLLTFYVKRNSSTKNGYLGRAAVRYGWTNGPWLNSIDFPQECVGKWVKVKLPFTTPVKKLDKNMKPLLYPAFSVPQQSKDQRVWIDNVSVTKIYDPK